MFPEPLINSVLRPLGLEVRYNDNLQQTPEVEWLEVDTYSKLVPSGQGTGMTWETKHPEPPTRNEMLVLMDLIEETHPGLHPAMATAREGLVLKKRRGVRHWSPERGSYVIKAEPVLSFPVPSRPVEMAPEWLMKEIRKYNGTGMWMWSIGSFSRECQSKRYSPGEWVYNGSAEDERSNYAYFFVSSFRSRARMGQFRLARVLKSCLKAGEADGRWKFVTASRLYKRYVTATGKPATPYATEGV